MRTNAHAHCCRCGQLGWLGAIALLLLCSLPTPAPAAPPQPALNLVAGESAKTKQNAPSYPIDPNNPSQMKSLRACEAAMVRKIGGTSFSAIVETVREKFISNTEVQLEGTGNWSGRQRMFQRYQFTCRTNINTNSATITNYKKVGNRMW